jgi:hypothetical protein
MLASASTPAARDSWMRLATPSPELISRSNLLGFWTCSDTCQPAGQAYHVPDVCDTTHPCNHREGPVPSGMQIPRRSEYQLDALRVQISEQ